MDHEFIDSKNDMFAERDDTYSSIKHEFSRIFHENNLHSFTNASDIGFIDLDKPTIHKFSGDYDDLQGQNGMGNMMGRSYYREEPSPRNYMGGMNMHNSYSPMTFLQSNLPQNSHYNTGYQNMMNIPQKGAHGQDPALYMSYPSYQQYADYGYSDYSTQPNSAYPQNYYDGYDHSDIVDTHHNNPLSLMWSNETAAKNATNVKVPVAEEPVPTMSQAALNKRFASAPVEDYIPKKPNTLKVEQDMSNRTLSAQLERASKTSTQATESNTGGAPRRTTRNIKTVYNNASFNGEDDESGSDDDKDEAYGNTKSRSSRGLRVLSLKVRDIVAKKKKTSYKEVADALLEDLSQKLKGKSEAEISKEEQNVKRRVYDALNVLIAADVLRKEGKFVCLTSSVSNSGSNKKSGGGKDKDDLLQQIQELKRRRKEKMDTLQELVFKSLAIKNLVRKNKEKADMELVIERATGLPGMSNGVKSVKGHQSVMPRYPPAMNAAKIDINQNNPTLNQKNQDIIHFPFIVLKSTSPENSMNLDMEASQRQLSIESRKPFEIFGDIDILLKMRLHYVPRQIFDKDVPKELQKYIAQTFINALN